MFLLNLLSFPLLPVYLFAGAVVEEPRATIEPLALTEHYKRLMEGARREGKVVVMGSADPVLRKELPERFKARFGIPMEYLGGRGGDNIAKLRMERQAGIYSTDAVMAGMSNMVEFYSDKLLDPLLPALVLPEVIDASKWKRGRLWFMDPEGRYILRLYNYVSSGLLYIHTQHAKPDEFKSIKDLLHPKWRGRISLYDPMVSGTGEMDAIHFYLRFGEDFFRKLLLDQKPVISRDKRQIADWLGRGTYPVSISSETEAVLAMKKQGLPVEMISLPDDPGYLSAGNGLLALLSRAPHPYASALLVNWVASREGLEIVGRARQKPTTRNDIDESYAVPWEVPRPGVNYLDAYDWEFTTKTREEVRKRVREILSAR